MGVDLFVLDRETKETAETSNTQRYLQGTPQSFAQDIIINTFKILNNNNICECLWYKLYVHFIYFLYCCSYLEKKKFTFIVRIVRLLNNCSNFALHLLTVCTFHTLVTVVIKFS